MTFGELVAFKTASSATQTCISSASKKGCSGCSFTSRFTLLVVFGQPSNVTTAKYSPDDSIGASVNLGFTKVEEKLLGPNHSYVAPATKGAAKSTASPEQAVVVELVITMFSKGACISTFSTLEEEAVQPSTFTFTL